MKNLKITKDLFEDEKITLEFISDVMCDGNPYWDNCYRFVKQNWNRDMDNLTLKQGAWLAQILEDCVEKRIEG